MKKEIGISSIIKPDIGNLNHSKLAVEFFESGIMIEDFGIYPDTGIIEIVFNDKDEMKINEIIKAHNPTPLPEPKTEMELLGEKVELLDGTLTEVLFNIIPTLQGGV